MIATFRVKDLIKYLVMLILLISLVVFVARFFLWKRFNNNFDDFSFIKRNNNFLSCINVSLPFSKISIDNNNIKKKEDKKIANINRDKKQTSRGLLKRMLDIELPNIEKKENDNIEQEGDVEDSVRRFCQNRNFKKS